ncbi:7612_t:CDS:2, partial [Scutellospora calospora]
YMSGAGAQEENLFRRTNLFEYHEPKKNEWYPIPEFGGIYCPNATVIRSSEADQYSFLEVPETMSFVAVSALRRPKITRDPSGKYTMHPEAKAKTSKKIKAILNIGLDN